MRYSIRKNRGFSFIVMLVVGLLIAISNVSQAVVTVTGDVDVDNFQQVFTGDTAGTSLTFIGGVNNGPNLATNYNFVTTDQHLYIAAWSDDGTQQGLLHDFAMNANPVWSGNPAWEVYATGLDLDGITGPSTAQLSAQIATANAATGGAGTSGTWVAPTVGGINNGAFPPFNPWVQQPSIATNANWVWYDSGTQVSTFTPPFQGGFDHFEYLIFRTPLIPEPGTCLLMMIGMATLTAARPSGRREVSA